MITELCSISSREALAVYLAECVRTQLAPRTVGQEAGIEVDNCFFIVVCVALEELHVLF